MKTIKKISFLLALTFVVQLFFLGGIFGSSTAWGNSTATIKIHGDAVIQEKNFTVDQLKSLREGRINATYTMQTLVEPHHGRYSGVNIYYLLNNLVGIKNNARSVKVVSVDGISVDFTIEEIKKNDYINSVDKSKLPIILAYAKDGHGLVKQRSDTGFSTAVGNDGGPIRLMVGQLHKGERNSPKCLKSIKEIIVTTKDKGTAFTDIGKFYSWAQEAIDSLAAKGIITGLGEGKFAPDKTLTRAEFATILVRSLDLPTSVKHEGKFKDVKGGEWYSTYVEAAASKGLIKGFPDGTFRPNQTINRQEMINVVIEAMGMKDEANKRTGSKITYRDKNKIPVWVKGHVELAEELNLLDNISVGYFNGERQVNRAEAAAVIYRMLNK